MTSKRETSAGHQHPLQLLLAGSAEQSAVLQSVLRTHAGDSDITIENAATLDDVQARLDRKVYDLLVFAQSKWEAEAASIIKRLRGQGRRVPLIFLGGPTGNPVEDGTSAPKGSAGGTGNQDSPLIRTVHGAVVLGRAEQQRREVEDTFRTLYSAIEQSADLVLITDSSGIIEYVNPAFEKLTGYSRAEVIGQTPRILKSGEQGPELYRQLWERIRGGTSIGECWSIARKPANHSLWRRPSRP